ncbi:MAG: DNA-protecting protein DprA [Hyphomicrobiales bacterium]|nr:DNA-protecting protein DprA [Hyphomicrobiales bacterium]
MTPALLSDAEKLARLRLIRSENIGPLTFRTLLHKYATAVAALEALPELAQRGGKARRIRVCDREQAEKERALLANIGGCHLFLGTEEYPTYLSHISDAPPVLTMRGDPSLLKRAMVAMVGTRNASSNGRLLAHTLADGLGNAGMPVVSGLARGIDTAAHQGALPYGTVAVLAGGVDVVYPPENQKLYDAIAEQGVILAEMPPGATPRHLHFPRRNRIISGLSGGVVVVEAARRSGSLITARYALEQGREVFAVPGFPLDGRAEGPNWLLRQGATLVERAEDITEALAAQRVDAFTRKPQADLFHGAELEAEEYTPEMVLDGDLRTRIIGMLGASPIAIDQLIADVSAPAGAVHSVLLELELAGRLQRQSGARVALLIEA